MQIDVGGKHIALGGNEQHVIEGEPFLEEFLSGVQIDHSFLSFSIICVGPDALIGSLMGFRGAARWGIGPYMTVKNTMCISIFYLTFSFRVK